MGRPTLMTADVIALTGVRGGAGATTICLSLGQLWAALGRRVLVVDADTVTNGLTLLCLQQLIAARRERVAPTAGVFEVAGATGLEATPCPIADGLALVPAAGTLVDTTELPPAAIGEALQRI